VICLVATRDRYPRKLFGRPPCGTQSARGRTGARATYCPRPRLISAPIAGRLA
jgi:hypothetical protein